MELAGIVEALGPDTDGPAPGTRVLAACRGRGAWPNGSCLPASRCLPLPDAMPLRRGRRLSRSPMAPRTWRWTTRRALQPGETLFVTGAAGGVGLTAVEIGKRMGARVIASARGAERLAMARAAGADVLIDSDDRPT